MRYKEVRCVRHMRLGTPRTGSDRSNHLTGLSIQSQRPQLEQIARDLFGGGEDACFQLGSRENGVVFSRGAQGDCEDLIANPADDALGVEIFAVAPRAGDRLIADGLERCGDGSAGF